jgi:hypothetical protein
LYAARAAQRAEEPDTLARIVPTHDGAIAVEVRRMRVIG